MAQQQKLVEFLQRFETEPKQRTAAWLERRQSRIGGSELSAALGLNPYCPPDQVLINKTKPLDTNIACSWGVVFEPILMAIVEAQYGTTIVGSDIYIEPPPQSAVYKIFGYSPDGFVIIDNNPDLCPLTTLTLLLELKCPFRRRLTGSIPQTYLPQILAGLDIAPIADMGLYIEAIFRKCSLLMLDNTPRYDRNFHKERTNPKWCTPLARGVIVLYSDSAPCAEPLDLGACPNIDFEFHCHKLAKGLYKYHNYDSADQAEPLPSHTIIAYLPWKMFEISHIPVRRQVGYLDNAVEHIKKALTPSTFSDLQ